MAKVQCPVCRGMYARNRGLFLHLTSKHHLAPAEAETQYNLAMGITHVPGKKGHCPYCEFAVEHHAALGRHIKAFHPKQYVPGPGALLSARRRAETGVAAKEGVIRPVMTPRTVMPQRHTDHAGHEVRFCPSCGCGLLAVRQALEQSGADGRLVATVVRRMQALTGGNP